MSSQTLIIKHSVGGGADCEQKQGTPHVVVEMLAGDAAGLKAAIPMSPILMDHCRGTYVDDKHSSKSHVTASVFGKRSAV